MLVGTPCHELEDFVAAKFTACMPLLTATDAFTLERKF